jgi:hypothetical protein
MATDFEDAGQRTIEKKEQRNNMVVEFAEIKSLLGEIDDFISKLQVFKETSRSAPTMICFPMRPSPSMTSRSKTLTVIR